MYIYDPYKYLSMYVLLNYGKNLDVLLNFNL